MEKIKLEPKIEVRRLNDDELPYIISLQNDAADLLKYYNPDAHKSWLNKALIDIKEGSRVGFGAFLTGFKKEKSIFIGSAIIKKATRQLHVEIKNLIIKKNFSNEDIDLSEENSVYESIKINAQKKLLSSIEQFCSARGFAEMEIEFPADLTEDISFFLEQKYRVVFSLESRYRQGDYHYILAKKLDKLYTGDPFDNLTVSSWLIHDFFDFSRSSFSKAINAAGIEIENSFTFQVAPREVYTKRSLRIEGACVFENDANSNKTDYEDLKKTSYDLKIYITSKSKKDFEDLHIRVIDRHEISQAFGLNSTINTTQMRPNEVAGLLLVVGSNFKKRILSQNNKFYYLVSSGIGYALLDSELVEKKSAIAAFCSEQIDTDGNSKFAIWGYSIIENFNKVSLKNMSFFLKKGIGQIWTDSELNYYLKDEFSANLNEYRRVSLLVLDKVCLLSEPIGREHDNILSIHVINYLNSYSKFGVSSCYIDKETSIEILKAERAYNQSFDKDINKNIMIQSIIDAISFLANLVTITNFTIDQVDGWKSDLEKNTTSTELIVSESRLSGIIDATTSQLDKELSTYKEIIKSSSYTMIEKDEHLKIIASRALKVLETMKAFKTQINDYDNIVLFLNTVANSKIK